MAEVTDPIITFTVKLPRSRHLRVILWAHEADMYANTPEEQRKDFNAIFVESQGRCLGTLHLSADHVENGTRAHEIRHVVDYFAEQCFGEELANVTERVTSEVDKTLLSLR